MAPRPPNRSAEEEAAFRAEQHQRKTELQRRRRAERRAQRATAARPSEGSAGHGRPVRPAPPPPPSAAPASAASTAIDPVLLQSHADPPPAGASEQRPRRRRATSNAPRKPRDPAPTAAGEQQHRSTGPPAPPFPPRRFPGRARPLPLSPSPFYSSPSAARSRSPSPASPRRGSGSGISEVTPLITRLQRTRLRDPTPARDPPGANEPALPPVDDGEAPATGWSDGSAAEKEGEEAAAGAAPDRRAALPLDGRGRPPGGGGRKEGEPLGASPSTSTWKSVRSNSSEDNTQEARASAVERKGTPLPLRSSSVRAHARRAARREAGVGTATAPQTAESETGPTGNGASVGSLDGDGGSDSSPAHGVARPPPQVTPFSLAALRRAYQLRGCRCSGPNAHDSGGPGDTGLSLRELLDAYTPPSEHAVPSAAGDVAELETGLPYSAAAFIDRHADLWQPLLTGQTAGEEGPPRLSLERSCVSTAGGPVDVRRSWDIDAVLLHLDSLAALHGGVKLFYHPRWTKGIIHSWHARVGPSGLRPTACKHVRLFRALADGAYDVYLFFPNLPVERVRAQDAAAVRRRCALRPEQLEWLIDEIVLPAVRGVYPSRIYRHHPPSYRVAFDRSYQRTRENVGAGDRAVAEHGYDLPAYDGDAGPAGLPLARLWDAIRDRLQRLGDEGWWAVELVAVTYGCKNRFYGPSLSALQRLLHASLSSAFAYSFINEPYSLVDLAWEDEAAGPTGPAGHPEALFVLHRAGCLQAAASDLDLRAMLFCWHGVGDAASSRAEAPARSALREGGYFFQQSYHTAKDLFAPVDRSTDPAFGSERFAALAFPQATLDAAVKAARGRAAQPANRRQLLAALRHSVVRTHNALEALQAAGDGSAARSERRISLPLFFASSAAALGPSVPAAAAPGAGGTGRTGGGTARHWPYYFLRAGEAVDFIRMQIDRWLTPILALIGAAATRQSSIAGRPALGRLEQHEMAALLQALFDVLTLTANSGHAARLSRVAKAEYYVHPGGDRPTGAALAASDGLIAAEELADNGEGVLRRGLGVLESLQRYNLIWLSPDLCQWPGLCFNRAVLPETAYASDYLRRELAKGGKRHALEVACEATVEAAIGGALETGPTDSPERGRALRVAGRTLRRLCYFLYSNWLLAQLAKTDGRRSAPRLPLLLTRATTAEERLGFYGLNYDLIRRSTGHPLFLTRPRARGGQAATTGGFANFPLTWEARVRLLFDWDDGFRRANWDEAVWRRWARRCYARLAALTSLREARRWRELLGRDATPFITVIPHFEADKLYQSIKAPSNLSLATQELRRELGYCVKWIVAFPEGWRNRPDRYSPHTWSLLTKGSALSNPLEPLWARGSEYARGVRFEGIDPVLEALRAGGEEGASEGAASEGEPSELSELALRGPVGAAEGSNGGPAER